MTSDDLDSERRAIYIYNLVHIYNYSYNPHFAMSIPHSAYDPRRVFRFNLPHFEIGPKARSVGTYLSGGLVRYNHLVFGLQSPLPLTSFPDLLLIQYKRPSFLRQRHPIPTSVRSQCLVILPHYHWAKIPAVRTLIFHPIRRRYSLIPCQTSSRCAI